VRRTRYRVEMRRTKWRKCGGQKGCRDERDIRAQPQLLSGELCHLHAVPNFGGRRIRGGIETK
jgi:hypothetical protein